MYMYSTCGYRPEGIYPVLYCTVHKQVSSSNPGAFLFLCISLQVCVLLRTSLFLHLLHSMQQSHFSTDLAVSLQALVAFLQLQHASISILYVLSYFISPPYSFQPFLIHCSFTIYLAQSIHAPVHFLLSQLNPQYWTKTRIRPNLEYDPRSKDWTSKDWTSNCTSMLGRSRFSVSRISVPRFSLSRISPSRLTCSRFSRSILSRQSFGRLRFSSTRFSRSRFGRLMSVAQDSVIRASVC